MEKLKLLESYINKYIDFRTFNRLNPLTGHVTGLSFYLEGEECEYRKHITCLHVDCCGTTYNVRLNDIIRIYED